MLQHRAATPCAQEDISVENYGKLWLFVEPLAPLPPPSARSIALKQVKAKKLNESVSKPVPQPTRVSARSQRKTAAATLAKLEASTRKEKSDSEGDEDTDDAEDEAVEDSSDDEADNGKADPGEFVGGPPEVDAVEDTVMDVDAEAVAVEPEPKEIKNKEISESAGVKDNGNRAPNSNLNLSELRTFVATPNGTCVAKHACNVRRPFLDADSNTQPLGLGFDESQVSPAKNEIDIDEDQPLGERMRKKAKLLEDEAKQLEAKAKQLENKAVDATEASVDDAPCK